MIIEHLESNIIRYTLDDSRWYYIPEIDKFLPSDTWVADYWPKDVGFYKWLAGSVQTWEESRQILKDAGERGGIVHNALEMIMGGLEVGVDTLIPYKANGENSERIMEDFEYRFFLTGCNWLEEYRPVVLNIEQTLWSERVGTAGTADLICLLDLGLIDGIKRINEKTGKEKAFFEPSGQLVKCICDWKTSSGIYPNHLAQVSSYVKKYNEHFPDDPVERAFIIRLGTRSAKGYEFKEVDVETYFRGFMACKTIWEIENPEVTPRTIEVPAKVQIGNLFQRKKDYEHIDELPF